MTPSDEIFGAIFGFLVMCIPLILAAGLTLIQGLKKRTQRADKPARFSQQQDEVEDCAKKPADNQTSIFVA